MRDIHKLEDRVMLLASLRNTQDVLITRDSAYKRLLSSDFGKVVVIDLIEKYMQVLTMVEKHDDNDSEYYRLKGQLSMIDWLLNTIRENLIEKTQEEV